MSRRNGADNVDGDWAEYRRLVVKELRDRFEGEVKMKEDISELKRKVEALMVRASLAGFICGMVPALMMVAFKIWELTHK